MDSNPIDAQSVKVHADPPVQAPSGQGERVKKVADTDQPAGGTGLSIGQAKKIAESLEGLMDVLQTSLSFIVDRERDQVIVTITNRETKEVIRQIPPEELVVLQEKMKELTGIIFNEVA
jgi:uncharacterized FlaG/YvyC family protein